MTEEEHLRSLSDAELETRVLLVPGSTEYQASGRVLAEHRRRQREYAETQERSRREFEPLQMDRAAAVADKQLGAAVDVAEATKWAVWATALAAFGALVQGAVAVIGLLTK
jgi:uncharacterized membrane protein YcjF (UPF0283 family)